jgi:hypothetical protein
VCGGSGKTRVTSCPKQYVGDTIAEACRLSDWATENSLLPVSGGVLDQCETFMEFSRLLRGFEAEIVADRKTK